MKVNRISQAYKKGLYSTKLDSNPYTKGSQEHYDYETALKERCSACVGLGQLVDESLITCTNCNGMGYIPQK